MSAEQESRQALPVTGEPVGQEALENLRAFFAILQEWDREDREKTEQLTRTRHARAARTIAGHFAQGVESR